jgi:hypothetical protein
MPKQTINQPFITFKQAKEIYDVLLFRLKKLEDKKDKLEDELNRLVQQRYDMYEVDGKDMCTGIKSMLSKWINSWQNLLWHLRACRYGDTLKVIVNEKYCFERTDACVKNIEDISGRVISGNEKFCACSVEGLVFWSKYFKHSNEAEEVFRDSQVQNLHDSFERLLQESADVISDEICAITKAQSKEFKYSLLYGDNFTTSGSRQDSLNKFRPNFEVHLSFTSNVLENKPIITIIKPKAAVEKSFIKLAPKTVKDDDEDEQQKEDEVSYTITLITPAKGDAKKETSPNNVVDLVQENQRSAEKTPTTEKVTVGRKGKRKFNASKSKSENLLCTDKETKEMEDELVKVATLVDKTFSQVKF